ncbi:hypothetical protein SISNIDRAFT_484971 [Sistotremastrum niveocremeum HHB9708]|uniref:Alpha-type protein kinase domain-containing protein n=1 Tax=Sistotremastrum niveocremeum HHB9708 TaxID=1314777 RepID=A0A164VC56_9AGAM|nr:hypothetical protein SISNIDRAFT_484971 [Sistotremastrum niveocremeum HHB9708]
MSGHEYTGQEKKRIRCHGHHCRHVEDRPWYTVKEAQEEQGYQPGRDWRTDYGQLLCPQCFDYYEAKRASYIEEQEKAAAVPQQRLQDASNKAQRGHTVMPVQAMSPSHNRRSSTNGAQPGGPRIANPMFKRPTDAIAHSAFEEPGQIAGVANTSRGPSPRAIVIVDAGIAHYPPKAGSQRRNISLKFDAVGTIPAPWTISREMLKQNIIDALRDLWNSNTQCYDLRAHETRLQMGNGIALDGLNNYDFPLMELLPQGPPPATQTGKGKAKKSEPALAQKPHLSLVLLVLPQVWAKVAAWIDEKGFEAQVSETRGPGSAHSKRNAPASKGESVADEEEEDDLYVNEPAHARGSGAAMGTMASASTASGKPPASSTGSRSASREVDDVPPPRPKTSAGAESVKRPYRGSEPPDSSKKLKVQGPGFSKRSGMFSASLDTEALREAMSVRKEMSTSGVWRNRHTFEAYAFFVPCHTIDQVIENKGWPPFEELRSLTTSSLVRLDVDTDHDRRIGIGAFKTAHPATLYMLTPAPDDMNSSRSVADVIHDIIAKKYYIATETAGRKHLSRYQLADEIKYALKETRTHYWCATLFDKAVQMLEERRVALKRTKTELRAPVPILHFVTTGVAVPKGGKDSGESVYLIEQRIPGEFFKYISNDSWRINPKCWSSPQARITAEYIVCVQHLIFVELKGDVVPTDMQGSGEWLTDAQLLTSDDANALFGDGNNSELLSRFRTEHVCTHFCEFYGLGQKGWTISDAEFLADDEDENDNQDDDPAKGAGEDDEEEEEEDEEDDIELGPAVLLGDGARGGKAQLTEKDNTGSPRPQKSQNTPAAPAVRQANLAPRPPMKAVIRPHSLADIQNEYGSSAPPTPVGSPVPPRIESDNTGQVGDTLSLAQDGSPAGTLGESSGAIAAGKQGVHKRKTRSRTNKDPTSPVPVAKAPQKRVSRKTKTKPTEEERWSPESEEP